MIGRCLGVHTDIGRDIACPSFPAYLYIHGERVDVAYLASYYARWYALPAFSPGVPSFFFFSLGWLVVRISRADLRILTTRARRVDVNFYTRFAVQPLISECAKFVVLSYILATEARRGPLIWKYSVTVIKDALGFEARRSLLMNRDEEWAYSGVIRNSVLVMHGQ